MRVLFKSFIALSGFSIISCPLLALQAPWKNADKPTAPWLSSARKENRENFFRSMFSSSPSTPRSRMEARTQALTQEEALPANVQSRSDLLKKDSTQIASLSRAIPSKQRFRPSATKPFVGIPEHSEHSSSEGENGLGNLPWASFNTSDGNVRLPAALLWPVEHAKISSGYGLRGGRSHEGLDLSAPSGTSIRATADGRVVFSGRVSGYGNMIVIHHGSGITSVYAHNARNLVPRGLLVKRGTPIARVGMTGSANGFHCHFEIRENGVPINPLRFRYTQSPLFAEK